MNGIGPTLSDECVHATIYYVKDNDRKYSFSQRTTVPCMLSINYLMIVCMLVTLPGCYLSRNHQGRSGTTVDIGDNLLPCLTVL